MGCEISKNTTPVIEESSTLHSPNSSHSSITKKDLTISPDHSSTNISPPFAVQPVGVQHKHNGSAPLLPPQLPALKSPEPSNPKPSSGPREPIAFELSSGVDASLIKCHPPKKFQKLEEQQMASAITQEVLDTKQAEAQERRQQIISKRVQSAKQRSAKSAHARSIKNSQSADVDEIDGSVIESPENDGSL